MYVWHKIEPELLLSIGENKMIEITIADKRIVLLHKNNNYYAFTSLCPHAGAPMCEGWLDVQGRVVCPMHKYRFDPKNGRNTSGEGYKLFTYPLEEKDSELYIGFLIV